ncbi:hypothetical protein PHYBLDRAFT_161438 [Phycomyces blakesleeanus NRRL 1555(-)]|uniref:Uncharacterized protein n=1 Tax=Phycomyces blakesleeanus (strain ATCC 8743b / DSM 1359 / FGSC 10004 / NBRC 33097 / NRRL 1555) TaxID=763407 RepID=A0A162YHU1_PHYB8|nr:hypothetical protein PHYBLDRAFT_161438 [Phycomyces blakesleeanus NRRL 1555(-)]OAD80795.1 hypothetical protein PHYBLDRAFT_161438 [Phycomyces blakesleeanus NRRL 1555(-)]|eukprot:XP_018298835.1 hypothetical protein PHYBLDRAFT_161438 [Phycomyces blakesleeanus NRRL 1555(-)]
MLCESNKEVHSICCIILMRYNDSIKVSFFISLVYTPQSNKIQTPRSRADHIIANEPVYTPASQIIRLSEKKSSCTYLKANETSNGCATGRVSLYAEVVQDIKKKLE